MTRRDQAIVGSLLFLLALITVAVVMPAFGRPAASPPPSEPPVEARPYREGVVGRPGSISPLTARTQVDRDIVELVFSGLVRLGPQGTFLPELASSWTSEDDGRTWVFRLREDARWHDGTQVTAEDVAFTIRTIQDPEYVGPAAASWRNVTATSEGKLVVRFELESAIGGFLFAATQPIAPAHLLRDVPVPDLPDHSFGQSPVGSGPFALTALDERHALLEPAAAVARRPSGPPPAEPTDALATAAPTPLGNGPLPYLSGVEFRFYDDPAALARDYEAGDLDAASGLTPASAVALAAAPDSRLLRYPGSTVTVVALNLRTSQPAFRDAAIRTALLAAIDRKALIARAFAGTAAQAHGLIPPTSWAYDPAATTPIGHDVADAKKRLEDGGWTRIDGSWALPKATEPLAFDLLSPDKATNAGAFAAAAAVAAGWREIGLDVTHVGLPAAQLVSDRLRTGDFAAAVVDLNIGLDPDLYPLLASTQSTSQRTNFLGLQDAELDKLLLAARQPGSDEDRRAAYTALQELLSSRQYVLPLAVRNVLVVVRDSVSGPVPREVADPSDRFWDVLTWRLAVDR